MRKWIKRLGTGLLIGLIAISGVNVVAAKTVYKKPPPNCKHHPCRR